MTPVDKARELIDHFYVRRRVHLCVLKEVGDRRALLDLPYHWQFMNQFGVTFISKEEALQWAAAALSAGYAVFVSSHKRGTYVGVGPDA